MAAARLQCWAIILSAYQYEIKFRSSSQHANADALSRLPLKSVSPAIGEEAEVFQLSYFDELPVTAKQISEVTCHDPILSRVLEFTMNGWPNVVQDESLKPYFGRRNELSADQGCILWGRRVVIPSSHRKRILEDLHDQHPGICRMKAFARSYLWGPNLDKEIETKVRACNVCQTNRNAPPAAPIHPWNWPSQPWKRIHIDHFEFEKNFYLIVIDSHSKWIEVIPTRLMTASKTIEILRNLFSSYGLPEVLVSDNGPGFVSKEFQRFTEANGIRHIVSPPYHPASNGAAERAVQVVKQALRKQVLDTKSASSVSVQHRLSNFLLKYRCTPHTVTGQSTAELFLKRPLRNTFSLLKPNLRQRVEAQQDNQLKYQAKNRVPRTLDTNQTVRVRNYRGGREKWVLGTIVKKLSPRTFQVRVQGETRMCHMDQLVASTENSVQYEREQDVDEWTENFGNMPVTEDPVVSVPHENRPTPQERDSPVSARLPSDHEHRQLPKEPAVSPETGPSFPAQESVGKNRRYPQRSRRPPERLMYS